MLLIRDAQFEALRLDRRRQVEGRLMASFASHYPEDFGSLGEGGALGLVRATLEAAARYKVEAEPAISNLMRLFVEFGRELELAPFRLWALRLLDHPTLPGDVKVNLVCARLFGMTGGNRMVRHQDDE